MSDAALDRQYEESLQRCRDEGHPRLFFFRVDGIEVGVCGHCSTRFVADPMQGDGSEWDQAAREAGQVGSPVKAREAGNPMGESGGGGLITPAVLPAQNPAGEGVDSEVLTQTRTLPSSAGHLDAAIEDHPAGGRSNICAHCRPRVFPGPSGVHMRHELSCSDKPGQRIDAKDYAGLMPQGSEPWRGRRFRGNR